MAATSTDQPTRETEAPVEEPECPRCGTPYEPLQEYCLECGARLPVAGGVQAALASTWRRGGPWYRPDWAWPVLFALVVGVLASAAVVAYRSAQDDGDGIAFTATGPTTGPLTTDAPPEPTATAPTETAPTETRPTTPTRPSRPRRLVSWPAGRNGFTVVLASIPTSRGRAAATAQARRALRAGFRDVGVLVSSRYASLHPGYYVVFTGIYDSLAAAQAGRRAAAARGYSGAYARPVTS